MALQITDNARVRTIVLDRPDALNAFNEALYDELCAKTGVRQDNQVQIVSGLKDGEQVVTAGAYGLPDNTRVQLRRPQPTAPVKESEKRRSRRSHPSLVPLLSAARVSRADQSV